MICLRVALVLIMTFSYASSRPRNQFINYLELTRLQQQEEGRYKALSVKKPIQTNLRTDPASVPILMKFTYEAPKNRLENIENYIQHRLENQEYLVENLNGGRGIFFPKQGEKHFDGWG